MATFFGVSAVPVDGASAVNATTTITITPPASMVSGDLVVVYCQQRGNTAWTNGVTGGQSWTNDVSSTNTTNVSVSVFSCTFNGTWSVNPRFDNAGGTCTSAVMVVFRPINSSSVWAKDAPSTFLLPAAATQTLNSVTPTTNNSVVIGSWHSADDNTWGTLTGTNWTKGTLSAQYRNTSGQDQSMTLAYQLQTTATATNNVSQTQLTLGNDATTGIILTYYETTPPQGGFDPFGTLGFFGL